MRLRRLEVADWAGIASAAVDLEPGLNVLHGPNELGKSSLVEAVRAVLLLQSGSTVARDLKDWNSDAPPRVELTFDQEEQRVWRVRKTFRVGGGESLLEFSRDGLDFRGDSRGREADGRLNEMLGWGARPPGGRGGPRGMPSTLIATALFGLQDEVAAILERSLADDPADSGRERLMNALEGLAEDPRLKQLIDAVQEKVAEAYTPTGRRVGGRASPWARLKEDRLRAEKRLEDVRSAQDESEGVRSRVTELVAEKTAADAEWDSARKAAEEARAAAARIEELERAERAFREAEAEATRLETGLAELEEKRRAVERNRLALDEVSAEHAERERRSDLLANRFEQARERVRDLEAGGDEQGRRLREQEAENRLQGIVHELAAFDRQAEAARGFVGVARRVDDLEEGAEEKERKLAEARDLIAAAEREIEADEGRLRDLELERLTAEWLAARRRAERRLRELGEMRRHVDEAEKAEAEAASLRGEAAGLRAPGPEEMARLEEGATARRIAREKLEVGLVVDVELAPGVPAEVRADGAAEAVPVEAGRRAGFEAAREIRIDLPGVAAVRVRGGGKELTSAAEEAEREFLAVSRPLLERTGAASVDELGRLARRAEELLARAGERERGAAEARVRAEGLDEAEREEALARADGDRRRRDLAQALGGDDLVDERGGGSAQPRDAGEVAALIDGARQRVADLREQAAGLRLKVERDASDLERDREELAAAGARLLAADFDWRAVLAGETERRESLGARRRDAKGALEAARVEATAEVEEARQELGKIEEELAVVSGRRDDLATRLGSLREELAGLEAEVRIGESALEQADLEAARAERERRREIAAGLAEVLAGAPAPDLEALERRAEAVEAERSRIAEELLVRRGALEHVGGDSAEDRANQAEEEVEAVRVREADLEVEYEAWRLLAETLREVEKEETPHIGKALVGPVSSRIGELTGGRYGDLAIDPDLRATGILQAGRERSFASLSVGVREQIATLLRVALADALGAFVVLDDQLTQTDKGRLAWLRELLAEAATRIQVVVTTCHPEHYEDAPGARLVDLSRCIRRSASPTV